MDEEAKRKLTDILARKKKVDATEREALERKKQQGAELEKKKAATDKQWPKTVAQIRDAVISLNEIIENDAMLFEVGAFAKGTHHPSSYGRLSVQLQQSDKKDRAVHFNISDVGRVLPVFSIPHSGKHPAEFDLFNASTEKYTEILTDFLEQVVDHAEKTAGRRS